MIVELNARSREVFRHIVDGYVATGEPVGSRTIARRLEEQLSPATIRNVMADLEELGLLYAPHTSAGRLPTEAGLRFYVDGLLEVGNVSEDERRTIGAQCSGRGRSVEAVLSDASDALSDLTRYAGLVAAPSSERPFKHIEFVSLGPTRALVIVVSDNGLVENRVVDIPLGMSASRFIEAGNYLTARLAGRSIGEARARILDEIEQRSTELDELTTKVVSAGLATWSQPPQEGREGGLLIVRGHAKLLQDVDQPCGPRAHPDPVRDAGDPQEHAASPGADPAGARRADLHRGREPAVQPLRLLDGGGPLPYGRRQRAGAFRGGCHRRDRPHPHELCPDHPPRRLHGEGGEPASWDTGYRDGSMTDQTQSNEQDAQADGPQPTGPRRRRTTTWARAWPRLREPAPSAEEMAEMKDRLLRTLAEMENLRARTAREVEDVRKYAITGFARDVLEVADNLGRALASVPAGAREGDEAVRNLMLGVEMTERSLQGVMEKQRVRRIAPQKGDKFDPNLHQAMFEVPTAELPPGTVAEVMQAGYVLADRLLRPALVGVAKAAGPAPAPGTGGQLDTSA